jgi:hypothetical protein
MQPARIEVRGALPRLASGKYDMETLRGVVAAPRAASTPRRQLTIAS